jgi:hypothetical protein
MLGPMKSTRFVGVIRAVAGVVSWMGLSVVLSLGVPGCGSGRAAKLDPDLARLIAAKRAQAKELAALQTNSVPGEVWRFFDAIQRDDWRRTTNVFEDLQRAAGAYYPPGPPNGAWAVLRSFFSQLAARPEPALNTPLWCPIHETLGVGEVFHEWDLPLLHRYGRDIIDSIPSNSIYFGGTDPGRFVITALSESHQQGRPFFTLTQNALADGRYLDYLRQMYGSKIYIPTSQDSQAAFSDYLKDAQQRQQSNQLKPGEDVRVVNGRVQVSGQVAVMMINGLLVKIILDHNLDREFYLEESFPLDWAYPHLSPHGLILKLNREPLPELSEALVGEDRAYWIKYAGQLIGDWITDDTSVNQVCDFAERVYLRKELSSFRGEPAFLGNPAAHAAYSKLRSAIAGVYAWRADHAGALEEKSRIRKEADFAFRQALALCPYSPEAVFRYVNLLLAEQRPADALRVAHTCQKLDPSNIQVRDLVEQLKKSQ